MLKNMQIIGKGEKSKYDDYDVYEKSSAATSYNLYDQSWSDLQAAGLAHLFENEAEFIQRKGEMK